jgi:hypothetical protein
MGATLVWDNEQMVPYAYAGDQWVGLKIFILKHELFYTLNFVIVFVRIK